MSRPQLSSGDSESSGTSVDSSGTTATSATSLTSGSQLDGLSPSSPPQPSEESKSTNGIELQELDDGLNEDANSNDENLDDQQAFPGRSTSATGVEPPERRGSSFSASSLAFFGLNGEKWRRVFLLHICLALIFNGFTLALAIYSTFWGDNNVLQKLDEMQKPIGDVNAAGKCSDSAQQDRLEALARWNSFNNWIMSCSAYAKQNITSGRCKGALESFDRLPPYLPIDSHPNLEGRSLEVLARRLRNITNVQASSVDPTKADPNNLFYVKLLSFMWTALFLAFLSLLSYKKIVKVIKRWIPGKGEEKQMPIFREKSIFDQPPQIPPVVIRASASNENDSGVRKRRTQTTQQLQSKNAWVAAAQGDVGAMEGFFSRGECKDIDAVDPVWGSILHAAAQSGKSEPVSYLLKKKANPNTVGGKYHTPLQAASYSGNKNSVERLLESGAHVNAHGGVYGAPLLAAAERGSAPMVKLLLDAQADPNVRGGPSSLALHSASTRGNAEMILALLERGADINAVAPEFSTAVHAAAMQNQRPAIGVLISNGADLNKVTASHGSPLQAACREGHGDLALQLLGAGADPQVAGQDKRTPLHFAANAGHKKLAEALVQSGIDVNARDADEMTPLHHASLNGHREVVDILLRHGADVAAEDKFRAQALFRAAGQHHGHVVALLLEHGSPPNARDCFGRTALHGPAADENIVAQQLLIQHGADINIVGEDKKTPLHEAANVGNLANVKLLLSQSHIQTSHQDNDQKTPLQRAIDPITKSSDPNARITDHEEIAMLLLDAADLDINARSGSALQEAIVRDRLELVSKMLDRNASVHLSGGRYGGTVQAAVWSGNPELLALLISRGANVNTNGGEHGTALQAAAYHGELEMLEMLLENGANVESTGGKWGSVLKAAEMSEAPSDVKSEIIRTLTEVYQAKPLPYDTHEKDEWRLTAGGWAWVRPDPWENVNAMN